MPIEKRKQEIVCNVIKALEVYIQTESIAIETLLEVNDKESQCEQCSKKCCQVLLVVMCSRL